ncbi:MAG: permease [Miltoncostaeaceae bacterium]|nr:permease [Miltoncostaeaceae bacterium]
MSTLPGEPRARVVLVIANETCASAGVAEELAYRARGGAQVVVVAPALARSRLGHWLSSDLEHAQEIADRRLSESLASLEAAGIDATGYLGDADPLQALDDALRVHEPVEVIISTHPPQRSNWLERQVVRRARERYAVPITHIVVDVALEGARTEEDRRVRPAPPPERRLRLFHTSSYDGALDIREHGFRDEPAPGGGPGVLVTDRAIPAGDEDAVLFQVELPEVAAAGFEREPAKDGARRFVVPAELLNRHGPVAVGDWSE